MNAHVRDAIVTDFEQLTGMLGLPARDDRHFLDAAIKGPCGSHCRGNLSPTQSRALAPLPS
jgi:hypothetical protein